MLHVATWIRESDEENFSRFFACHPAMQIHNARTDSFDPGNAHGLLITGGPDVGAEFHPVPPQDPSLIEDPEPDRDAWEFAAVRSAYERGLPMLCICKGLQVLNLALGGTLHLDVPGHRDPEMKFGNLQPLRYESSTPLRFEHVNSSHHQALDRIAAPLVVEAWHAGDGVVEQVRLRDYRWGVGVQYHPERDLAYAPLFDNFFAQLKP